MLPERTRAGTTGPYAQSRYFERPMGGTAAPALREAALHLDRHRHHIEIQVNRRLGREEPTPYARSEIVRRFRSFSRLASVDWNAARPSLDGLAGNAPAGLERAVEIAVEIAIELAEGNEQLTGALRELGTRFRAGIRRSMQPRSEEERSRKRNKRRPDAGRRVRAAIDRISDAYIALCLDTGTIFDLNPAAEALFGAEPESLLRRELVDLIGPKDLGEYRNLEARLDAGEDSGPATMVFKRLNGELVPVEFTVATHTIGGRRLAIFSARERSEVVLEPTYSTRTSASRGILPTRESTARST